MTIYKMLANVKRNRFMERPLFFTQEMNVIAESYDKALAYVKERFPVSGDDEVKIICDSEEEVMALFDIRSGEEKIIV